MKVNRKASIIVYVMVLLTFAIGFSYLVLSNLETMNNNINLSKINNFERKTLYANAILNLENDKKLNSDGSLNLDTGWVNWVNWINWLDWINDDANDDNFKVTPSQWSYPDDYFDNDADARKNIFWTILENKLRVNIFANSKESNDMILENVNNVNPTELLNNSSPDFKKLPEIENANFEINFLNKENFSGTIEIVKISKTSWEKETKKIDFQNSLALIQNLDFKNNYYQLFLNVDSGFETKDLLYKISEKSWAYINPIRDDLDWIEIYQNIVFNYAWRDILKWQNFSIPK